MRASALVTLLTVLTSTAGFAAPRKAAPPAPPRGKEKLPNARPTPGGKILTLKPGQTRLTPEQMKALGLAPKASPRRKPARKR